MFNKIRKYFSNSSIRQKLLTFFLLIIFCISNLSIYLIYKSFNYIDKFNQYTNKYFMINKLQQSVDENNILFEKFINSNNIDNLSDYNDSVTSFYSIFSKVQNDSKNLEVCALLNSIKSTYTSYCEECDSAIKIALKGDSNYFMHYQKAIRINLYLKNYLSELLQLSIYEGNIEYKNTLIDAKVMRIIAISVIITILIILGYFGFEFSDYLTQPIKKLAYLAKQMSEGNLDVGEISINSTDEVGDLSKSFNIMSNSINNMVKDLNEKSLIEKKLHEEELENIKNNQLLKEARFLALQSQINPHFLFNTLNTISRVITFSRPNEAIKLIDALSTIARYNLGNASNYVALSDEINITREYVFIQQYRFGKRINVDFKYDNINLSEVLIPRFTLQPLVENAIIHGLEPKEEGGRLRIKVYVHDDNAVIKIIDNGVGISKERIESIMSLKEEKKVGHTSSIGISNVLNRLIIFCGNKNCLEIRSKIGLGTVIEIKMPV